MRSTSRPAESAVVLHPKKVGRLPAIDGRLTEYRDLVVPGLVLRVTPAGHRSLSVRYRRGGRAASYRRITFGPLGKVGLAKGRRLAREVFRQLAAGEDPAAARRRELARSTLPRDVEELVTRCLEALELRDSTRREWERVLEVEIAPAIGRRPVDELARAEVRAWRDAILTRSRHTANTAYKVLRRAYSWALRQDILTVSPCAGLGNPAPEVRNDRWLRPHELRALWKALGDVAQGSPYPDVVRLLLLTGLRRGEALAARRAEFHDLGDPKSKTVPAEARWIVPAERMKGDIEHVVPLSRQAAKLVRERLEAVKGALLFPALGTDVPGKEQPAPWLTGFVTLLRDRMLELVREDLEDPKGLDRAVDDPRPPPHAGHPPAGLAQGAGRRRGPHPGAPAAGPDGRGPDLPPRAEARGAAARAPAMGGLAREDGRGRAGGEGRGGQLRRRRPAVRADAPAIVRRRA